LEGTLTVRNAYRRRGTQFNDIGYKVGSVPTGGDVGDEILICDINIG